MKSLSIIIPVYKTAATLHTCVASVLAQDVPDMEVILVDDGSPDECPQLCDEWALRDSRLHVVHKANGGLSDARNAGLRTAKGQCVTFVDSDDYIAPHTYQALMPLMSKADIVEYPLYWHYGGPDQQLVNFGHATYQQAARYWLQAHAYQHTYACNKMFRRSLFGNVSFPVGRVFEDAATLPLLLARANRVVTSPDGLYYYCHNPKGITAQADGKALSQLLDAHLDAMAAPHLAVDDRYYMHVLNIQLDVCRLTHEPPRLPRRHVNPFGTGLPIKQRVKAAILTTLGMNCLCKAHTHLSHQP